MLFSSIFLYEQGIAMENTASFLPIILTELNRPWEKVINLGTTMAFPSKSVVAGGGGLFDGTGMFYIRKGLVRLSHVTQGGAEHILLYLAEGMLFNEIPMLHPGYPYLFTSLETLEAVYFPHTIFTVDFCAAYPDLARNLIKSLGKKGSSLYALLASSRARHSFASACYALLRLFYFSSNSEGGMVPRLSQQELATFLGMHRSSLHLALVRLQQEGIIGRYHKKGCMIHNPDKLLMYANEEKRMRTD